MKEQLITERLILRKLRKEDAEPMFYNWCNDPEVAKYTLWVEHQDVETTKQLVDMWLEEERTTNVVRFMITLKDSGTLIGSIDTVDFINGVPEIGYCLSRQYWNRGYMTEACQAFINYLIELGYSKIVIRADVRNISSNRVIEKCGFKYTHQEFFEHRSPARYDESVTVNWYELEK